MLFPASCPGCGTPGDVPCAACRSLLRPVVAGSVPAVAGVGRVVACFEYRGPGRALLTALKYRNNRAAVAWLGACLADAWSRNGLDGVPTWAPTTAARARRRGFDQSELLARSLARSLGRALPAGCGPVPLLVRLPGPAQTGRAQRERADAAGFGPRPGRRGRSTPVPPRVVLVDDVLTTGSTLAAAAAALRRAGCGSVDALVVGWTPPHHR